MKAHLAAGIILLSSVASAMAGPKEELMAVDRAFARMSIEKGYDEAYIANLARDGYLFVSHAENLAGFDHDLQRVAPAVYRRRKP